MSSKRIKEIVKEAELDEGSLDQYLSSKGINPKFVPKATKISHAKSGSFQKWKNDHKFEEVETEESLVEDAMLDKYLSSRGINPKYVTRNMKVSHAKSHEFVKWKHDHMVEEVVVEETDKKDMVCMDIPLLIRVLEFTREEMSSDIELHNMVERLINMRHDVPLDMTHYDAITSKLVKEGKESALDKFRKASAEREKKHDEIEKKRQMNPGDSTSAIDRLEKHLNKEENELAKKAAKYDWSKRMPKQKKPIQHYGQIELKKKQLAKEDVFQDPQAATQTVFDNGTSTNDTQEKMSKSARMIKALYKKLNMKEDTYDWEKDDKNQTSPGKKTKEEVKEKPEARAILTGGKTLTGDKRDTLEIDPMMKNRPDLNGTVKDNDNSKKNNKINN